jgi:hypothetical protein
MRADLELAMGRVITSGAAFRAFTTDPQGYAASYHLDCGETLMLMAMQDDLSKLMPQFVQKRLTALRKAWRRTMVMLGHQSRHLLQQYTDRNAPTRDLKDDQGAFGEYLIAHLRRLASTSPDAVKTLDIARAEQMINRSVWNTRSHNALRASHSRDTVNPEQPIRLSAGSDLGRFGWDLRWLRDSNRASPALWTPDRCVLLFYHTGTFDGIQILRLKRGTARAMWRLRDSDTAMSARQLCQDLLAPEHVLEVLSRFRASGIIEPS